METLDSISSKVEGDDMGDCEPPVTMDIAGGTDSNGAVESKESGMPNSEQNEPSGEHGKDNKDIEVSSEGDTSHQCNGSMDEQGPTASVQEPSQPSQVKDGPAVDNLVGGDSKTGIPTDSDCPEGNEDLGAHCGSDDDAQSDIEISENDTDLRQNNVATEQATESAEPCPDNESEGKCVNDSCVTSPGLEVDCDTLQHCVDADPSNLAQLTDDAVNSNEETIESKSDILDGAESTTVSSDTSHELTQSAPDSADKPEQNCDVPPAKSENPPPATGPEHLESPVPVTSTPDPDAPPVIHHDDITPLHEDVDDEDDDEDLLDLSLRIAQKSQAPSRLYRLVKVMDAGDDAEDYQHDDDFTPPAVARPVETDSVGQEGESEVELHDRTGSDESLKRDTQEETPGGDRDNTNMEGSDHDHGQCEEDKTEAVEGVDETVAKPEAPLDPSMTEAGHVGENGTVTHMQKPKMEPRRLGPEGEESSSDPGNHTRTQIALKSGAGDRSSTQKYIGLAPDVGASIPGARSGRNRSAEFRRTNAWKHRTYKQQINQEHSGWGYSDYVEDEEENFVLTSLFRAVEEGNLDSMRQILEEADNFNINQSNRQGETLLHTAASGGFVDIVRYLHERGVKVNAIDKHGDSAIYWAARQGHLEVIKYLKENGVNLDTQNKAGEAPLHVASRYGHVEIMEYLCNIGADVNIQDKLGETALHTVAWHGMSTEICAMLCAAGAKVDLRNKENESPLHCAASRGNLDCVRLLLSHGASLNVQDKRLNTPLHLACRRRYIPIALLMLHAGCAFDTLDCINETPLHPACKEGLLPVVQTMCAYGCQIDVVNKAGLSPLHLAARCGHTEVVRCLLLSGAEPELPNKDGVTAEIMALAQGHQEVAELLAKLKPERREVCIKQLIPTNQTLNRIKIKVFGSSGVGKTTLINSLKCGYISSFFRKARLTNSASVNNNKHKAHENGSVPRQASLPTCLSYSVTHENYTRGIDVQQINIAGGPGDVSLWEFSGYEPYYVMYDHFIGDPNCVHVVVFNLSDPQDVQLSQLLFWLTFIKARIAPMEPIGPGGRLPWPARVLLVATHADKVECTRLSSGELESSDAIILLATVKQKFETDLYIQNQVFVMDAHLAMSPDVKALRAKLAEMKSQIVQFLPCSNGFLEAAVSALATWRKVLSDYPVVSWPVFIEHIRSKVNLLASEEHLKELMCQLQLLGEVIYIETENEQDLVVLNPRWLTSEVIGHLLSHSQLRQSRPTGCFSVEDFQLVCPETDAKDMLVILEALELCTRCEVDSEVEYEFPCLNFVEQIAGLWEKDDARIVDPVYGGVRIHCPRGMNNQLLHMFPRIQIHLRRDIISEHSRLDADLYQWYHGSKFCSGNMECLITLAQSEQVIEIKCRGPAELRTSLYYFLEDVCDIVLDVLEDSCPGICLEKYVMSCSQLSQHKQTVYAYTPKDILSAQLSGTTHVALKDGVNEEFIDLVGFGSEQIWNNITPGVDLHAHYLSIHARRRLSMLLDPPDPMGRDWCLLAVSLGLTEDLPKVDQEQNQMVRSKTDSIIDMWSRDQSSTIAALVRKLKELGRQDAADTLLTVSPLYHVFQDSEDDDKHNTQPLSCSSDNTLSSSNLSR